MAAISGLGNSIGVLVGLGFEECCEFMGLPVLVAQSLGALMVKSGVWL